MCKFLFRLEGQGVLLIVCLSLPLPLMVSCTHCFDDFISFFLNIPCKWNNLVSLRPNYFIFIGYLNTGNGANPHNPLLIRHCIDTLLMRSTEIACTGPYFFIPIISDLKTRIPRSPSRISQYICRDLLFCFLHNNIHVGFLRASIMSMIQYNLSAKELWHVKYV